MKFQYVGDKDAPKKIVFMGIEFELNGEAQEILNPKILDKMKGHRSFVISQVKHVEPTPVIQFPQKDHSFDIVSDKPFMKAVRRIFRL